MHYAGVVWPDNHSLKNCSSTTSLYALTGSGRDLKISAEIRHESL